METSQNCEVFEGISTLLITNFQVRSVFFRDTRAGGIEVHTRKDALFPPVSEMNFLSYTKEAFQTMISRNPQALLVKMSSNDPPYCRTVSQNAIRNALRLDLIYPRPRPSKPEQGFFGRIFSCMWEEDPLPLPIMKRVSRPALHLPSDVAWTVDEWGIDIFQDFVRVDIPPTSATSLIERFNLSLCDPRRPADARISACATVEGFIVNDDLVFLTVSSAGKKYLITLAEFKKIEASTT